VVVADFLRADFLAGRSAKAGAGPAHPARGGQRRGWLRAAPWRGQSEPSSPYPDWKEIPRVPISSWAKVTAGARRPGRGDHKPARAGRRPLHRARAPAAYPGNDPTLTQKLYAPSNQAMGMLEVRRVSGNVASGLPDPAVRSHTSATWRSDHDPDVRAPGCTAAVVRHGPLLRDAASAHRGRQHVVYAQRPRSGMLNDFTLEYYFGCRSSSACRSRPWASWPGARSAFLPRSAACSHSPARTSSSGWSRVPSCTSSAPAVAARLLAASRQSRRVKPDLPQCLHPGSQLRHVQLWQLHRGGKAIPVAKRFNLYLSGGGAARWAYGMLASSTTLRGGGGPGTVVLSASGGGAWVSDRCDSSFNSTNAAYCLSSSIETVASARPGHSTPASKPARRGSGFSSKPARPA